MAPPSPEPGGLCGPEGRLARTARWAGGETPAPAPTPTGNPPSRTPVTPPPPVTVPGPTRLCVLGLPGPHAHSHARGTHTHTRCSATQLTDQVVLAPAVCLGWAGASPERTGVSAQGLSPRHKAGEHAFLDVMGWSPRTQSHTPSHNPGDLGCQWAPQTSQDPALADIASDMECAGPGRVAQGSERHRVTRMHRGRGFSPWSGHLQQSTNKYINKWNDKSMCMSP